MPISIRCAGCGQRLKAKDSLAGRIVPCPKCGHEVKIEPPEPEDETETFAVAEPTPRATAKPAPTAPTDDDGLPTAQYQDDENEPSAPKAISRKRQKQLATHAPLTMREPPLWLRHLHWLLVLIPLGLTLLYSSSSQEVFADRLDETLEKASPQQKGRVFQILAGLEKGDGSVDDFFAALPEQRFVGAFLPRTTWVHWLFALLSAALFMTFIVFLATGGTAKPLHLLSAGLFTATAGILFLLAVQWVAEWTQGIIVTGRGILVVLFYVLKAIGYSYRAAVDPSEGFVLSFLGYTFGVGLCEELVKALPLVSAYRRHGYQGWRTPFLWGLASGTGFGIAEGIIYSTGFYNGITGPGVYVVRFVSCVALHAVWSGSVGITLYRKQEMLDSADHWAEYIIPMFVIIGIPMVLHGLYDTLLKKDMNAAALAVAVVSLLYLALQISMLHGADDAEANKEMLREYKRRRLNRTTG